MATKESVIQTVQKLLALAMDDRTPEHERLLAQDRADRLMVRHMLDQADLTPEERSAIVRQDWPVTFSSEFSSALRQLLGAIFQHTQCRAHTSYQYVPETKTNYRVTVVGTPENINYAERLWMVAFTELVRNMFPKWDSSISFDANVYAFVKAGFKWRQIHEIAWKHVSESNERNGFEHDPAKDPITDPFPADKQSSYTFFAPVYVGDGGRLKRAYNRETKRMGEATEHHTSRHGAYRASYVSGFSATIRGRLRQMRRDAKQELSADDNDRYALAIRTTEEVTDEEFYRLFPQYDPKVQQQKFQEANEAEIARRAALSPSARRKEDEKRDREEERARKHYSRIQRGASLFDDAGYQRGGAVANKVNLRNDQNVKPNSRKGIES
jgi:hypothetical protein